ncbi:MAG: ribonuclease P protein component [Prevotella sp.]|nr:ribonuclease P protein component [Prevotella sp.]
MARNRFPKSERLVSDKLEDMLFATGRSQSATAYPLRAVWLLRTADEAPRVQLLVSAPKKRLHHAVDRNRAKRQIREAWRLNSQALRNAIPQGRQLLMALIWMSPKPMPTQLVFAKTTALLEQIRTRQENQGNNTAAAGTAAGGNAAPTTTPTTAQTTTLTTKPTPAQTTTPTPAQTTTPI